MDKNIDSNRISLDGFRKVFSYANEHKKKTYAAVVLVFFSVMSGIAAYVFAFFIIRVFTGGGPVTVSYVSWISAAIIACGVGKGVMFSLGLKASHEAAFDTLMEMRIKIAGKLMSQPIGEVNAKGSGSYKKKVVDDIESLETLLAHIIPEGLPYAMAPFVVYLILFIIDWRLGLLSMGSLPFGLLGMGIMAKIGIKGMKAYYASAEKMNKTIIEYISGMQVIKIFGRAAESYERYASSVKNYKVFTLAWYRACWPWMAMYGAVLPCTILLLLPVGLWMVLTGSLAFETYVFSLMLCGSLGMPLMKLLRFIPGLVTLSHKISEIEKVFDGNELKTGDCHLSGDDFHIEFNDVTFSYDKAAVIRNVTFEVNPGTVTAIVGESGSGKSTLARLLVHYWDVNSGTIDLGGVNIADMPVEELMRHIAYVSQDTFLFNMSIMENIRIGKPEATDEEVTRAAKLAQCHEFVTDMRDGYDTDAGDAGTKMSGGERQRITIARAILKNAPIIILDEATSFTDPENEDKIQEALGNLMENKTVIVIAHRLSTISEADNIIVMDAGRVSAQGMHDRLLSDCERYQILWAAHEKSTGWQLDVREAEHA